MRFPPTQCHHDVVLGESEVLSLPISARDEVITGAVSGDLGACDVWFHGPAAWLGTGPQVVVRLYARHAAARVLVGEVNLLDTVHTEDTGGVSSAWVFAARGVEAQGFEVSCQRGGEGPDLTGGQFFLRAARDATAPTLLGKGGIPTLRAVTVPNVVQVEPVGAVTITQSQASALQATVVQSTPSALQATVVQSTPSALQATVVQPTPSALQATVVQSTPSALQATVVQSTPSALQATVVQANAASLQATVVQSSASALQATAAQGVAASAGGRWPVYLTDGAVALGTVTAPLYEARIRDGAASFAAVSGLVGTGTSIALKSLAYLWHPSSGNSSSTKRVEIRRIVVSYLAGGGTGPVLFRATRISAVSATPNGTTVSATVLDGADSTGLSLMTAPTNAPTRSGGDVFAIAVQPAANDTFVWQAPELGKPIVLRASLGEGIEVLADVKNTLSPAMQAVVSFEWVEV